MKTDLPVGEEALDLLTYKQVAKRLRVSEKTVSRLADAEQLTRLRVGVRSVRFAPAEVARYEAELMAAAQAGKPAT